MTKYSMFLCVLLVMYSNIVIAQYRQAEGGGEVRGPVDQITEEDRINIQNQLAFKIDSLDREGVFPALKKAEIKYGWPLRNASNLFDYGVHGISNFVDHDHHFPNVLSDYMCGARTYDRNSGYNHAGTDMYTWPFSWYKMDNDQVEVVASAPGVIIDKRDGNFDRSCTSGGGNWNAVYVRHIDGSVVWYGHLKSGSLTSKNVGDDVLEGEFLGIVGSSGNSTGPHLHIEFYDPNGKLIDPYKGACNEITSSLWANQPAYYDSKVNAIKTHLTPPEFYFNECSQTEEPNFQDAFFPGDNIKTAVYYRDQLEEQTTFYTITRPSETVYRSWNHNSNSEHYSSSYWYWSNTLDLNEEIGVWEFEAEFLGQKYTHEFTVSDSNTVPFSIPLNYPGHGTLFEETPKEFTWLPLADADQYHIQISKVDDFANLVSEDSLLVDPEFGFPNGLTGTYYWRVKAKNEHGTGVWSNTRTFSIGMITSNDDLIIDIPTTSRLDQNYPNPFNPSTQITFELGKTGYVVLKVFNLIGQEVSVLQQGRLNAGLHSVTFDASALPSGVYLYRLETPNYSETKRMILIK